jgi:protein-histidine pros-kinase
LKPIAKFNLMFVLLFGVGLSLIGYLAHQFLIDNARAQVVQQAELMMNSARSIRDYTTQEVKPLLEKLPSHATLFLPQTVPAYAATVSFNFLRQRYPEYTYKEATLNPTNLRDRAVDWEADVVNHFRDHPDQKRLVGERDTPLGRSLYLAQPIAAAPPCLECHSTPAVAPRSIIRSYGRDNGFGWKRNEIVAAQIVSVPESVPIEIANKAFRTLLIYLVAIFIITLVAADAALFSILGGPARKAVQRAAGRQG